MASGHGNCGTAVAAFSLQNLLTHLNVPGNFARSSRRIMADSGALSFHLSPRTSEPPTILVGVTTQQTCLVLGARLRVLRGRAFTSSWFPAPASCWIAPPYARGVERIAIPMRRGDRSSWPIWFAAAALVAPGQPQARSGGIQHPQGRLVGHPRRRIARCAPARLLAARAQAGKRLEDSSARFCWPASAWPARCAHVVLCNSESLRAEALALGLAPARQAHRVRRGKQQRRRRRALFSGAKLTCARPSAFRTASLWLALSAD